VTVINTNVSATLATNSLARNERAMTTAMERLSTGKRINNAGDDAAGLAIASTMRAQVRGLEQAARNVSDGISMVQTVEAAGNEIMNILVRMKELATQAASETYQASDITALDAEYQQLEAEITRIADNTEWNGSNPISAATAVALQIGIESTHTLTVNFIDLSAGGANILTGSAAITDAATAQAEMTLVDTSIDNLAAELAKQGANINRLEYAQDNLMSVAANIDASRSRIEDADYARETSELARTQIIAQAGTAMLAQANQIKQTVLALLQ
jgi:flagellin